jgi:(2Fe-2S) ferredoxin
MDLKVKGVVKHDGVWYQPGEVIKDVKPDDVKRLIDSGVAEVVAEPVEQQYQAAEKASKGKGSKKSDDDGG